MNNLQISDDYKPVLEHVKSFIKEKIEPMEEEYHIPVSIFKKPVTISLIIKKLNLAKKNDEMET